MGLICLMITVDRKYNLRTQDSSGSSPDLPSTSKQKVAAVQPKLPEVVSLDQKSENEEPTDVDNAASLKKAMATSDAMIALQQLASISTARSLQHLVQNMSNIDNSALVPGRKLPRYAAKRSPKYESNRCPLCSRVCRSQAFLNEHMRKEHSVLI
ncbi:GD25976 [Drosophila simulans]|uniref:GD25976 n=1 Tax=Drosophila simulans TaxID=7240 RepID=B4QAK2_DROSI|nr:GD25976 [Drosophila simulans]